MIDGKTLGVDATTLEANAALRSIVRRDTGESYESYLKELARKSGIEEPSRADIAKLDKKRPKKGSNKEWVNPNEPDAEIMKMKSGGTDMAHKAEHAVDMSGEGAVIAVTLHGGAKGDTKAYRRGQGHSTCFHMPKIGSLTPKMGMRQVNERHKVEAHALALTTTPAHGQPSAAIGLGRLNLAVPPSARRRSPFSNLPLDERGPVDVLCG